MKVPRRFLPVLIRALQIAGVDSMVKRHDEQREESARAEYLRRMLEFREAMTLLLGKRRKSR